MTTDVRRAVVADAEWVARLYVDSWNESLAAHLPPRVLDASQVAGWHRDLADPRCRWSVAAIADQPVGFVGIGPSRDPVDPRLGELDTIAVDPRAWRQGVGRTLMTTALADLHDSGYAKAIVWTPAAYERGRSFYESTGWAVSGEERDEGRQVAFRRAIT